MVGLIGYCCLTKLPVSISVRMPSLTRSFSLARVPSIFFGSGSWSRASHTSRARSGPLASLKTARMRVVRVIGEAGRVSLCGKPVSERGNGLPSDQQVLEVGLGLPQPVLQFRDLGAEIVCQGLGGVLLETECLEQGVDVHAGTACASRQVGGAPVSRRAITCVMAQ